MRNRSIKAFEEAKQYIVGGVNSPVRAFNSVGGTPPFIERGEGGYLIDIDGNSYIDYVQSWGPLILGHTDERIQKAVKDAVDKGLSFGVSLSFPKKSPLSQTGPTISPFEVSELFEFVINSIL